MNRNYTPRVVLLVGAGGVKNGWAPVLRALRDLDGVHEIDVDTANAVMASHVNQMRAVNNKHVDKMPGTPDGIFPKFRQMKERIAQEIRTSQKEKEIEAREALHVVINEFVLRYSRSFICITTNWDSTLTDFLFQSGRFTPPLLAEAGSEVLHLHGNAENANNLYLPSETSFEHYLTPEEFEMRWSGHLNAYEIMSSAARLVLYGISLSPLDAELIDAIGASLYGGKIKEVFVVDPNHQAIANKMKILFGVFHRIKLYGVPLEALEQG